MIWILIGSVVTTSAVGFYLWRSRTTGSVDDVCPECSVALAFIGPAAVPGEAPPSYAVWVCPRCPHAKIVLDPPISSLAICSMCGERSLEVSGLRMPDDDDNRPHVEIREM